MQEKSKEKKDPKHYISHAQLHQEWPSKRNIPLDKLNRLKALGIEIVRGRFSSDEDRRILKNWRRFVRHNPDLNDPISAFGLTSRPQNMDSTVIPCLKKKLADANLMLRMAYKLDERLICDIYARCKKLITYKKFTYPGKADIPEDLYHTIALDIFEKGHTTERVSSKFGASPTAISSVKRKPFPIARHRWKVQDDHILSLAIKEQSGEVEPDQYPTYKINWRDATDVMRKYGYELMPSQLYRRWIILNRELVGLKNSGSISM